ncbi:type 2 isopentenyl-diphosphate Delta-isomerase [Limosilactobacillus mucosae]|uniref:type 2 isopentenyl-diphosphate Delta-isomerase n=1 Tax=Limosilactobacillus mucosae TaxID=97478 RepID=UPI00233EF55C|nr:type 2 isopentenyl-diphosphate Delta-isomerase [Limosilactobacillus mucosae]MDC2840254.1 type 2 isopentenyl-diphosphate Delta-isomerase [Limosilactobacillus mucosae]
MESLQAHRKNEHVSLAEKLYQQSHASHPFDQVRLIHHSLPEMALSQVDQKVSLGNLSLNAPFYIEAMTGGSRQTAKINERLAILAHRHGLAMATGSLSVALKDSNARDSFAIVREKMPTEPVIANVGAGVNIDQAKEAINILNADAIEIHLNTAQELVMPEGDREFFWQDRIKQLVDGLGVPVIVKEVGFGMDKTTVALLQDLGVKYINVSGRGGTNFAAIENRRNHEFDLSMLNDWGQTTPESLLEARSVKYPDVAIIASGGITSPLDVIKAGALGASAVGVAGHFLHTLLHDGDDALDRELNAWQEAILRLLTLLGCHNFAELKQAEVVLSPELNGYAIQRGL